MPTHCPPCPLCQSHAITDYYQDKRRTYLQCDRCELVFVHPQDLPSLDREKQEYDLHQNSLQDEGYVAFLNRLCQPLLGNLPHPANGLDFGSGPAPVLADMFRQHGHQMSVYDPFYAPDKHALGQTYDFISCSEAIEHFHQPSREWQMWLDMLKPGGWLGIMTKRVLDKRRFAQWHYKNDMTHVSFFSEATFRFLAIRDRFRCEFVGPDVVLMQKQT